MNSAEIPKRLQALGPVLGGKMHSAKDILEALGFNSQAPESTKTAFLNQLSRAAKDLQKAQVLEPNFKSNVEEQRQEQLSFDSKVLGFKASS